LKQYTKEEIEANEGQFDNDGFYLLKDGDFYDAHGYYFDKEGFDATGGFYDDNGVYVPPPEDFEEYGPADGGFDDYYDELDVQGEFDSDVSDG